MTRKQIIHDILKKDSHAFTTKEDFLDLALMSEYQLTKTLIRINNNILNN